MLKPFPIPPGADKISEKAILAFRQKLGNLVISQEEIQLIINGIMKAQIPRDQERARKDAEKKEMKEARRRQNALARRSLA